MFLHRIAHAFLPAHHLLLQTQESRTIFILIVGQGAYTNLLKIRRACLYYFYYGFIRCPCVTLLPWPLAGRRFKSHFNSDGNSCCVKLQPPGGICEQGWIYLNTSSGPILPVIQWYGHYIGIIYTYNMDIYIYNKQLNGEETWTNIGWQEMGREQACFQEITETWCITLNS